MRYINIITYFYHSRSLIAATKRFVRRGTDNLNVFSRFACCLDGARITSFNARTLSRISGIPGTGICDRAAHYYSMNFNAKTRAALTQTKKTRAMRRDPRKVRIIRNFARFAALRFPLLGNRRLPTA